MWRNRIKQRTTVKASKLINHEGNWRIHPEAQRAGMVGVLNEVGIIDALTVYEAEDGLTVIDGHLRKSIDPEQEWPVDILDVSPEEADYILATKDPLAAAASADREKLGALLQSVKTGEAGVQALLGELAEREGLFELTQQSDKQPGNGTGEESGEKLSLLDITIEEPQHAVQRGQVWKLGHHILVCDEVLTGWEQWVKYLKPGDIFAPFPGPFVPLTIKAEKAKIVMVQPNPYIAGHIIDRWVDVNGEEAVSVD